MPWDSSSSTSLSSRAWPSRGARRRRRCSTSSRCSGARRRWRACAPRAMRPPERLHPPQRGINETPARATRRDDVERGATLPGPDGRRAVAARPRTGRGARRRAARPPHRGGLRQPVPARARDGGSGAGRHRRARHAGGGAARALARRVGGLHGRRGARARGRSLPRMAAGAARLPAAGRRAARRRQRPRPGGDRSHQRLASERRRRARRRARRRHQRVRVRAAGLLVHRAPAPAPRQTLGIILGADIGTTFTVQLIAFKVTDYALLLVGLGFAITFLAGRRVVKDVGQAILGLGLVFLGLKVILEGMAPLRENRLALELVEALAGNPLMAVLVAAVFSALVASSAATLGGAIALASHGLIGLSGAVAIVFGAHIGTCATALTASVGATAEAKRVAVAHIAFKVRGAALMLPVVAPFTAMVAASAADPARQIANAHTFFNLGISLVFLPFTPLAARTIEAIVPDDQTGDTPFRTRYLDERALDQPSLALGQATREALRTADVVQGMLRDTVEVFRTDNQALLEEVEKRDEKVDFLEREIKLFLARLGRAAMGPQLARM